MQAHLFRYAVGLCAGAAAAVLYLAAERGAPLGASVSTAILYMAAARGAALGLALGCLAPLPIMIATLGFGVDAGLIATVAASGLVAVAVEPAHVAFYALLIAGPAWALAALAGAPLPRRRNGDGEAPALPRYLSPSALALIAAIAFTLIGEIQVLEMTLAPGGYSAAAATLTHEIREALSASGAARALPPDVTLDEVAAYIVDNASTGIATVAAVLQLFNLYLAGRSAQLSQRLARPWRDIPTGFALPLWLAPFTLAAVVLATFGPAPASQFALAPATTFCGLYALQALAALHAMTRRHAARPFMLAALYFAVLTSSDWVMIALVVVGAIESFANLRVRAAQSLNPKT